MYDEHDSPEPDVLSEHADGRFDDMGREERDRYFGAEQPAGPDTRIRRTYRATYVYRDARGRVERLEEFDADNLRDARSSAEFRKRTGEGVEDVRLVRREVEADGD